MMDYVSSLEYLRSIDLTMERYERTRWDAYLKRSGLAIHFPFVHIAGSNGKGSTSSFIYRTYLNAGYRAGLFSKPFLYEEREMISLMGREIPRDRFASYVERMKAGFQEFGLSAFEAMVAIAISYFNDEKADIVVLETGMGGRLDATTIEGSRPLLSVITSVSKEHTRFLGNSLEEIAFHKAGIISPGCPLVYGQIPEEAETVIIKVAKEKKSPAKQVQSCRNVTDGDGGIYFDYGKWARLFLPSHGRYLVKDAGLALASLDALAGSFPYDEGNFRLALKEGMLPCRMEEVPPFLFDGGHNPEAISELAGSLATHAHEGETVVVYASFKDKDVVSSLKALEPHVDGIFLTTFPHKRAMGEADFRARGVTSYRYSASPLALVDSLRSAYPKARIVITGSLAFASYMRRAILLRKTK